MWKSVCSGERGRGECVEFEEETSSVGRQTHGCSLLQVQLMVLHPTAIILMSVVLSAFMKAESAFITGLRGRCLSCFNFGLFYVLQNVFKFRFSLKTRGEFRLLCCIHYAKFKKNLKVKIALEKGSSQTAPSACVTNIP